MPAQWTPERREAQAKAMRERHESTSKRALKRIDAEVYQKTNGWLGVSTLVAELSSLPVDSISYDDCGTLLNALSAASTAIALARRQKQEQLAAGSHRAPCSTCGRMIDISKSGGFQILTERDEHWQPRNVYYCSQNCLLAKNMPSHRVKKLPGDVGVKA